jgi:hypothetical protein
MPSKSMVYFCAVVLVWASCTFPCVAGTNTPGEKPTLQEKVARFPNGAVVVVKTRDKRTLTGRLGQVSSDGFELQYATGNSVQTETLAFTNVKSVKEKQHGLSTGAKIAIGAGLAAAALMVTSVIVCATGGCYN